MPMAFQVSIAESRDNIVEITNAQEVELRNDGGLFGASVKPLELPQAVLHVSKVRLDGTFSSRLSNTGRLPLFGTELDDHAVAAEGKALFRKARRFGFLPRGSSVTFTEAWSVTGILDVLRALIDAFFTGRTKVRETARIQAFGFDKSSTVDAVVPVGSVKIQWS